MILTTISKSFYKNKLSYTIMINTLKKSYIIIYIFLFLSVFFVNTFLFKLIIPFVILMDIIVLIFLYINNSFIKPLTEKGKIIMRIYIITAFLWVIRSYFIDTNSYFSGTPILTIFGSLRFGIFMYLLPLMFLFSRLDMINLIFKTLKISIFISILLLLLSANDILNGVSPKSLLWFSTSIFIIPFIYYIHNNNIYILILLTIATACYLIDERAVLINFIFCLFGYFCLKLRLPKFFFKIAFYIGIILSIIILIYSLYYGISIFEILSSLYSDETTLVKDTRSFIFYELANDLSKNNEWIFGKGILGVCYSPYFDNSLTGDGDSPYRIGLEIGFLQYLLKGGLYYMILFMITSIIAIYNALFKSNNNFMKLIGIILLSNFVMSCISQTPEMNPYSFYLWIMIGFCYIKYILELSDNDIRNILNKK